MRAEDILNFWFNEISEKSWWEKSKSFDDVIRRRFLEVYEAAVRGELAHWRDTIRGRLAEIIVLDQFPRNMFRDNARAFQADALALMLSQEAVRAGGYENWPASWRAFLFMPYMHSESAKVQEDCIKLFEGPGLENNLDFAHRHKAIIDRFGRYPHRNDILGRKSTPEEVEFLKKPGSSF